MGCQRCVSSSPWPVLEICLLCLLDYGRLGNVEYVVCKDNNRKVRAFHNVCRHHASLLATGCGKKSCFVCPYHVSSLVYLLVPWKLFSFLFPSYFLMARLRF